MEATVSATSVGIILIAPLFESLGISSGFVENVLVRLLLVGFLVYAVSLGHMPGLLGFLAVFSLLIERNHMVLTQFPNQKPRWPTANYGFPIQAAPLIGEREVIPFDTPHTGESESSGSVVENHGESSSNTEYENASDLRDSIPKIVEGPNSDAAPEFYKSKGLL
jgi:hypothetical protein